MLELSLWEKIVSRLKGWYDKEERLSILRDVVLLLWAGIILVLVVVVTSLDWIKNLVFFLTDFQKWVLLSVSLILIPNIWFAGWLLTNKGIRRLKSKKTQ